MRGRALGMAAALMLAACPSSAPEAPGAGERLAETLEAHSCPEGTVKRQSRHETGVLKALACFDAQGRREGPAITFDELGRPDVRVVYHDDRLDGPVVHFHPDGSALLRGQYVDGLEDGEWVARRPDGTVIGRTTFERGTGLRKRWYPNGQLKLQVRVEGGKPEGEYRAWHENGQLQIEATYDGGQLVGKLVGYHPNGTKSVEVEDHVAGQPQGLERNWSPDGTLVLEKRYDGGELHGKAFVWAPDGTFKSAACFVEDRMVWDVGALDAAMGAKAAEAGVERRSPAEMLAEARSRECLK